MLKNSASQKNSASPLNHKEATFKWLFYSLVKTVTKSPSHNTTLDQKVAITLEYDGESAPKVTAKGAGTLAEQIIKIAKENNIPITEDHDLVQLLSQVELDHEIPELLYEAVVQVLIFAYQLSDKEIPTPSQKQPETDEESSY